MSLLSSLFLFLFLFLSSFFFLLNVPGELFMLRIQTVSRRSGRQPLSAGEPSPRSSFLRTVLVRTVLVVDSWLGNNLNQGVTMCRPRIGGLFLLAIGGFRPGRTFVEQCVRRRCFWTRM